MAGLRVIKRYANRKLYDTQRSRYVTLEQIADMIRSGEDVKVIDNTSKDDLTSVTLAQIIFEEEKKQKSFLPLAAMRNIIQSGGESLQELASQAGARVRSVFRRDKDGAEVLDDGAGLDERASGDVDGESLQPRLDGGGATATIQHAIREFLERSQQTFDEWQKRVDERVRTVVETLAPWTVLEKEMRELTERLADLEKRLGEAE